MIEMLIPEVLQPINKNALQERIPPPLSRLGLEQPEQLLRMTCQERQGTTKWTRLSQDARQCVAPLKKVHSGGE